MSKRHKRIRDGDLPKLLRILEEGDSEQRCEALTLLCPCRNRIYDREIWQYILEACESDDSGVRDRAEHALGTLQQRAFVDPRTWDLIQRLRETGIDVADSLMNIATWGPRSRPSRRKRMTHCKTGRPKAAASLQFTHRRPNP